MSCYSIYLSLFKRKTSIIFYCDLLSRFQLNSLFSAFTLFPIPAKIPFSAQKRRTFVQSKARIVDLFWNQLHTCFLQSQQMQSFSSSCQFWAVDGVANRDRKSDLSCMEGQFLVILWTGGIFAQFLVMFGQFWVLF